MYGWLKFYVNCKLSITFYIFWFVGMINKRIGENILQYVLACNQLVPVFPP